MSPEISEPVSECQHWLACTASLGERSVAFCRIRVALPHPAELACFENEPGIATRLGCALGEGAPADSSGDEHSGSASRKGASSGTLRSGS